MPKCKAEQSVDEWLEEGIVAAEANRMLVEPNNRKRESHTGPTTEATQKTVVTEPRTEVGSTRAHPAHVAGLIAEVAMTGGPPTEAEVATGVMNPIGNVAITQEDAVDWFWNLLAQSGYERW